MKHIANEIKIISGFKMQLPSKIKTEVSRLPLKSSILNTHIPTLDRDQDHTLETIQSERVRGVDSMTIQGQKLRSSGGRRPSRDRLQDGSVRDRKIIGSKHNMFRRKPKDPAFLHKYK